MYSAVCSKPLGEGLLQALAENFALDYEFARPLALRPNDEQIGASPTQAILPLNAPAAVHDPLQKRLKQQLRAGSLVLESLDPML